MARFDFRKHRFALLRGALTCILMASALAEGNPGVVKGSVFTTDAAGGRSVVPRAKVSLLPASGSDARIETAADELGAFTLPSVPSGRYQMSATAEGLKSEDLTIDVAPGETVTLGVDLKLEALRESVTVSASATEVTPSTETASSDALHESTLNNAPSSSERFDSLLPLLPGVVRGPDGLINMKGARSSQGGLLLNSANVTDPVTGGSGINLPIDVVSTAQVISNPYDPEYGKLSGAVATVATRVSEFNRFHFTLQNFMPRLRVRDGGITGIEATTPRATFTGPLKKGRIAFLQSLEYRYVRTPVETLPPLSRDSEIESFDSFTQLDFNLSERQTASASLAIHPQKLNYLGLNTFVPQRATPDLRQRGYFGSFQHRFVSSDGGLLTSQFSFKKFDSDLRPNSNEPYRLGVESAEGGFFNRQHRDTSRIEWQEIFNFPSVRKLGEHTPKIGLDVVHNSYDGRYASLPVEILRASGALVERLDFSTPATVDVRQNEATFFALDKWNIRPQLTLDLGLRFDHDSLTGESHPAPRMGFALAPGKSGRFVLRGGAGLFYDRVNLNVPTFPDLPAEAVTRYASDGRLLYTRRYAHLVEGGIRNPRSVGWNVEFDQQVTTDLLLRVGYQQRDTVRDFVVEPGIEKLTLSSSGHNRYREFQTTTRYRFHKHLVNASYVRSAATGDLNDFNQFYGNTPQPVIRPNERSRLSFDAPNRFVFWGEFQAPWKVTLAPVLDMHTGFPFSVVNEERDYVGSRNRAGRFPAFSSVDLQVTKEVAVPFRQKEYKARIGFRVFNLFNHYNPRDLQNDLDSPRYGVFLNGVGRMFRGKLSLEF